ncbi:MAG: CPBP family glutamic-type intramembrane protease, partial [Anaerolineae bacterium]|nr:CPBP family glutamic-type intramembrane protease [Anaerolineae bacterium]
MRKLLNPGANLAGQPPRGINLGLVLTATIICGIVAVIARDMPNFSPKRMWHTRRRSIVLALTTLPDRQGWGRMAWIALPYFLLATLIGLATGFIRLEPVGGRRRKWVTIPLSLIVLPGIVEEVLFRVWLLPHPTEPVPPRRRWVAAVAALLTFVLAHPLNGMTISRRALPLFT